MEIIAEGKPETSYTNKYKVKLKDLSYGHISQLKKILNGQGRYLTQAIKYLPCKQEDLSSNLEHLHKKPGATAAFMCNLSTGEDPWSLLVTSLAESRYSRINKRSCLKKLGTEQSRKIPNHDLSLHTNTYMCMHMCPCPMNMYTLTQIPNDGITERQLN